MLKKNKKSAFILSCITVFSFVLTNAVLNILLPYLFTGTVQAIIENPGNLSTSSEILSLVIVLVVIVAGLIGIGTYWLYKFFGEAYYGQKSMLRWALFGSFFALFLNTPDWLIGERLSLLKNFLQLLGFFAAFFLARWIIPVQRKSLS